MPDIPKSTPRRSSKSFWQKGLQTTLAVRSVALYISFFSILLPQIFVELLFSHRVGPVVEKVKQFSAISLSDNGSAADFIDIMAIGMTFMFPFLGALILALFASLIGYFAIVHAAQEFLSGRPLPKTHEAMVMGLRSTFPRGLIAMALYLVVVMGAQVTVPPLVILLIPGIMIPVMIVSRSQSAIQSLGSALFLKYGKMYPGGAFGLFFQLISIGAFFYTGLILVWWITGMVVELDDYLPMLTRNIWQLQSSAFSFNFAYVLSQILRLAGFASMFALLAAYTVSLWHWMEALDSPLPEQGISI